MQKYNVRNQFSNSWSLETFDSSGPANYTDKFLKFEDAYSRVEQDAGYILNESLPDRSFRDALRIAGWDPTGDPQAAVVEWLNTDYSDTQPPDVSSELFNIANFNSTFYGFSEANNMAIDSRGFNAFLHGQASEFLTKNDSRLLLNTIVTNILYSEDGVLITNSDGGCIAAEYAITTFSLGVLKSGDIKFTPALPNWKDTAIQAVNMGIYTKIFMQFPPDKVFWNTSTEFFLYASPTRGYYPIFLSLDHENFYPGSGLLIATVVTDQSNAIEKQDDETTKQQVLVVLRQIYGEDAVPEPLDFMYPRWGMTPWAHGSYSNWPPGLTLEGHQNLRANVGRVWFAGEHTSAEFNGYLQGAYFEGQVVGESVAACVNGSYANCPGGKHYEMLGEISKKEDFTPGNGWFRTSFQTIGDVDLPGGE